MGENVQCPVCTLFLLAGMNLSDHLETHPKEQVIKALVKMTISGGSSSAAHALSSMLSGSGSGGGGGGGKKDEDAPLPGRIDESNESCSLSSIQSINSSSTMQSSSKESLIRPASRVPSSSSSSKFESSEKSLDFRASVSVAAATATTTATTVAAAKSLSQKTDNITGPNESYQQDVYNIENVTSTSTGSSTASVESFNETKNNKLTTTIPRDFRNANFSNTSPFSSNSLQRQANENDNSIQQSLPNNLNQHILDSNNVIKETQSLHQQQQQQHQAHQQHQQHQQQQLKNSQPQRPQSHSINLHATAFAQHMSMHSSLPAGSLGQPMPTNQPNFARINLPPPPPPPTASSSHLTSSPANSHASATAAAAAAASLLHYPGMHLGHQHNVLVAHQRQQHLTALQQQSQQDLKVIYSPALPPPPPLQIFPFQNQQQPHQHQQQQQQQQQQQHQRPPPAYGTAINQIRSQNYQNRHSSIMMGGNTQVPLQHLPQHNQLQDSRNQHVASLSIPTASHLNNIHRYSNSVGKTITNPLAAHGSSPPTSSLDGPHSPQSSRSSSKASNNLSQNKRGSTIDNNLIYPQAHQYLHQSHVQQQHQQQNSFPVPTSNQRTHSHQHQLQHQHHHHHQHHHPKSQSPLPHVAANQMPNDAAAHPTATSATSGSGQKQNASAAGEMPSIANTLPNHTLSSVKSGRSATPSSVLCYAEPPVAHYLERENGDFIVQETPKHIVECVEKENGEFSVIERIYQSPPSVLHIHDDDEDDDDDDEEDDEQESNHEPETESSSISNSNTPSLETKIKSNQVTDEDEFMSVTSESDNEYSCRSKSVRSKKPRRKSCCTAKGSGNKSIENLSVEPSTSSAGSGKQIQNQSDVPNKTSSHGTRKKKNTVTVLSDVQLNPNEYLDLVENIIATSKSQRLKLSSFAPLPIVKVEKEEPIDEYDGQAAANEDSDSLLPNNNISNNNNNNNDNNIDSSKAVDTENLVKVDKSEESGLEDINELNNGEFNDSKDEYLSDDNNSGGSINMNPNATSVIRMASSSNPQRDNLQTPSHHHHHHPNHHHHHQLTHSYQPACDVETNDDNIAEDLSKPQLKTEHESQITVTIESNVPPNNTNLNQNQDLQSSSSLISPLGQANQINQMNSMRSSASLLIKKGPKKLIIKPKATAKTDINAKNLTTSSQTTTTTTTTTSASSDPSSSIIQQSLSIPNEEELPTTSAMALKQQQQNLEGIFGQRSSDPISKQIQSTTIAIKSEPPTSLDQNSNSMDTESEIPTNLQRVKCEEANSFKEEQSFDLSTKEPSIELKIASNEDSLNQDLVNDAEEPTQIFSMLDNSTSSSTLMPSIAGKKIVASARYALPPSSMNSDNSESNLNNSGSECIQNILIKSSSTEALHVISKSTPHIKKEHIADEKASGSRKSSLSREGSVEESDGLPLRSQLSSENNFLEYPFNFLYNNGSVGNNNMAGNGPHSLNRTTFSPFYQNVNDATNAATLATSVASNTDNSRIQMEDSTSMPMALNNNFSTTIIPGSASNTNSQWFTNHNLNHFQQQAQQSHHNLPSSSSNQAHPNGLHHGGSTSQAATGSSASSDFNPNLAAVDCNVAVDSGDVGRYLDLDSCKREINHGIHANSSSSSFTAAGGDSNLIDGFSADQLNIRTDEKMPAKGEISEQESNCDIDNSWSQPMFGDLSARYLRTTFPGMFPHDNGCWGQSEFMDAQDLSGNAANDSTSLKNNKNFEFRFSQDASTSANLLGNMPSTSATTSRKKKKRDSNTQPTSTITSQQLLLQQQHQQSLQNAHAFTPENLGLQFPQFHQATSSNSLIPGQMGALNESNSGGNCEGAKTRKKSYQCPHCSLVCTKLKDRNNHLITMHNYVRQNRRLICLDIATTNAALPLVEVVDGTKEEIVKMEIEPSEPQLNVPSTETVSRPEDLAVVPKQEPVQGDGSNLALSQLKREHQSSAAEVDTKPNVTTLAAITPSTKLAAIYKMLVAYNASVLKQDSSFSDFDHSQAESSIFFCYVCRTNFSSVKLYDAHLTEHAAECFTCGKKFQRWKNFSLHLKRHMGWKEFACNVCDKRFVVRNALVEHLRMHTGQTPLKCKICGKHFKRYSNLTQHRKRHTKHVVRKKEYICHCGEVLPSRARYLWHKETHDQKPKCCPHCCDRFVHMNSLRRHIRLAHSDKFNYNEPMECPMCKQIFAKTSIKAHMATHSTDAQFSCAICNKTFSTKWNLKIHSWVHANRTAKPFKCEHCPKAFVRELDFKNHINAHKQIKPYTCEYCGCKFIRKYNYMRHRREHHGKKRFTCDCCDKSFHRHYYLIEHRRIHTGERPYQCTICGKSSTTKTNHNKHLKIHHSRDPFTVES